MASWRRDPLLIGLAALAATALLGSAHSRADDASPLFELVDAAARHLQVAEPVAAVKWKSHGAIEDPARVRQELDKLGADAITRHVDPATSGRSSVTR